MGRAMERVKNAGLIFCLFIQKENMDGPEAEEHVHLGATIMGLIFGGRWADFTLRHSRYWAMRIPGHVNKRSGKL
jgi:hypothetical protein